MKVEVWQKDMKIIGEYETKLGVPTPLLRSTPRRSGSNALMRTHFANECVQCRLRQR